MNSLKQVSSLLEQGAIQDAETLCVGLYRDNPGDAECLVLLAYIKIQLGKYHDAVSCSRKAIAANQDNMDARRLLGYALHCSGNYREAISTYRRILEHAGDDFQVYNSIGNSYLALDDPDNAIKHYKQALMINPGYAESYSNIGVVLEKTGKYLEALASFRKALEVSPAYTPAMLGMATVLSSQDRTDEAFEYYRRVVRMSPDNHEAWFSMGVINGRQGRAEWELACYQKAVEANPESTPALTNLGAVLNRSGHYDKALPVLRRAMRLKPDNILATFNYANSLHAMNRLEEATTYYEKVIGLDPGHAEAGYRLSILRGEPPPERPPAEYVTALFDQYAHSFDEHLTESLGYRTPEMLYSELRDVLGQATGELDILDLGCGTGLFGACVRPLARQLVGVDLSPGMIEVAKGKKIYDELHVGDVIGYMARIDEYYDVISSADVFPYIGDLGEMFSTCRSVLRGGGLFVFSVESDDTCAKYKRMRSGRYAHSIDYVRRVMADENMEECSLKRVVLRTENGRPVNGYIIVAHLAESVADDK